VILQVRIFVTAGTTEESRHSNVHLLTLTILDKEEEKARTVRNKGANVILGVVIQCVLCIVSVLEQSPQCVPKYSPNLYVWIGMSE
jgi:hypothetical protein